MHHYDKENNRLIECIIEESYLYEGLEITYPLQDAAGYLSHYSDQFPSIISTPIDPTHKRLWIDVKKMSEDELSSIERYLNNMGYYPSSYADNLTTIKRGNLHKFKRKEFLSKFEECPEMRIYFEAKYDNRLSDTDLPHIMYHVTPFQFNEKIEKIGLAPKSKSKIANHPSRIYLAFNLNGISKIVDNIDFCEEDSHFIIYKIDMKSSLQCRKIRFFDDPSFYGFGVYTYENIPPRFITIYKDFYRN